MAKGAAWTVGMRLAIRSLGMVSTIILARLLVPEDFGLIALATMLAAALEILGEFNFDIWLIRKPDADRKDYDTVWTLAIIRSVITCILLLSCAELVATFFGDPRLENIIYVLSVGTLIFGLENSGVIDFRKNLEFHKDFVFLLGVRICSFIITVSLAFWLRSYWALVLGIVFQNAIRVLLSYILHSFRPRFSLSAWHDVFHFSKWLLAGNLLNFLYIRSDTFILGKLTSTATLGVYSIAYEIANLATTELVAPIRRAIFPGYSKLAGDRDSLRQAFIDVMALTLMLATPLAVGIGLTASPAVHVLLGDKWLEAIPLIQILTIYGLASIAASNVSPCLLAMGKPQLTTRNIAIGCAVILPALAWGVSQGGATGAAWAVTAANIVLFLNGLSMALSALEMSVLPVLIAIWRTLASTGMMVVVVLAAQHFLPDSSSLLDHALELIICIASGAITYLGVHLLLWRICHYPKGAESQVIAVIQKKLLGRNYEYSADMG